MYADDTTLYCISNTVDEVAELLNTVLTRIDDWSHKNGMTVHPGKSEVMIIKKRYFYRSFTSPVVKWKYS